MQLIGMRQVLLGLMLILACLNVVHAADEPLYRLASGDLIKIHVFGEPELNIETRLGGKGEINYPFLGKITVAGLTVHEFEQKLISGLKKGYLKNPQVNVSIVEYRPFFIEGEVKQPGGYPYIPSLTIRKAVSLAGGFTEFAAKDKFIVVFDATKEQKTLDVNAEISPGDSIIVDKSNFYIYGEVKEAGSYPLMPGLTLREAISLAGGLTERASESNITITSKEGEEKVIGKEGLGTKLHVGDSVYIKQSFF